MEKLIWILNAYYDGQTFAKLLQNFWCNDLKTRIANRMSIFKISLVMYRIADETRKRENTGFLLLLWVAFNFEIDEHNNHTSISANQAVKYSAEIRHHHLDY